jgi:hypothetical protein
VQDEVRTDFQDLSSEVADAYYDKKIYMYLNLYIFIVNYAS